MSQGIAGKQGCACSNQLVSEVEVFSCWVRAALKYASTTMQWHGRGVAALPAESAAQRWVQRVGDHLGGQVGHGWVEGVPGEEAGGGGDIRGCVGGSLLLGVDQKGLEEGVGGPRLGGDLQEGHRVFVEHIVADRVVRHHSLLNPAQHAKKMAAFSPCAYLVAGSDGSTSCMQTKHSAKQQVSRDLH